jgi:DNA-binding NarL/FixJ family response regulator
MDNLTVVAEACSAQQAVETTKQHCPGVVISDVELLDSSGIEACREIKACCRDTAVVLLSTYDWDVYLARAWAAGANGFVVKTARSNELVQVIQQTATGERLFTIDQLQRIRAWQDEVEARVKTLTSREREVFRLMVAGCTNSQIARELVIALKTVETHVHRVLAKLGFTSRREVIAWAKHIHTLDAEWQHD